MKKILLTLLGVVCIGNILGQDYPRNIFGVHAGLNVAKIAPVEDVSLGFVVGVTDQILLHWRSPLYFEIGADLVGYNLADDYDWRKKLCFVLQVPLHISYHIYLGEHVAVTPFAGVCTEIGVSPAVFIRQFNLGPSAGLGVNFYQMSLTAQYGMGTFGQTKHNVMVKLGYNF